MHNCLVPQSVDFTQQRVCYKMTLTSLLFLATVLKRRGRKHDGNMLLLLLHAADHFITSTRPPAGRHHTNSHSRSLLPFRHL